MQILLFRQKSRCTIALLCLLTLASAAMAVRGFDGDGHTDIIWQNTATRDFALWFLRQTNFVGSGILVDELGGDWRIGATADFNQDGHADLFWRSPSSGSNEIWLMKESSLIARHAIPASSPDFNIGGAGDFDGDGYADLFWRDPIMNLNGIWFMDGTTWNGRLGWPSHRSDFNWIVGATADFNNDGFADILWRHRYSGENTLWLMNGSQLVKSIELRAEPDMGFQLAGVGSFNLLGNTDLLWRHTNGQNVVWLMSGTQYLTSTSLPTEFGRDWKIAGTGGYKTGMLLSARANEVSPSLTLMWRYGASQSLAIERRNFGATAWDLVATNYVPLRFTNSELALGQRYEYRVGEEYLLSAVAAAPAEDRGKIILVVEQSLSPEVEADFDLLKADLVGDGWSVIRTNVPRHDDRNWAKNVEVITSIKSFITNVYYDDPVRTKAVYLIGHVPIPYSGFQNPDGHGGRALPADVYYADVDGLYTDASVNFSSFLGPSYLTRHDNLIGDGKFDQNRIPRNSQGIAELELAVGRVDFSALPTFGAMSEAELTQRYFKKTHQYRHKQVVLPERVCVGTFFSPNANRDAYGQALRLGNRLFGIGPEHVFEGDPFDRRNEAVWGMIGGFGLPFAIFGNNFHQTGEMPHADREPKIAFMNFFGSFLADFHYADNLMRAFLATPNYGLAAMWFKPVPIDRVAVSFEPLGLGETIGTGFVRSMNESSRDFSANTFITLLGDPTLRLQVLAPPSGLGHQTDYYVDLTWTASPEPGAGYFVYRSTNRLDGPWIRMTPNALPDTSFRDLTALAGPKVYQVRAVKLIATGSGSYTNLSQGIFIGVD